MHASMARIASSALGARTTGMMPLDNRRKISREFTSQVITRRAYPIS